MSRLVRILGLALIAGSLSLAACGDGGNGNNGDDTTGDGGTTTPDSDPNAPDADPTGGDGGLGGCDPNGPQCNNCIDDDGDGQIDGDDIECTGAIDDDEDSFATGIPGDNMDVVHQDCFFDGNSGAGDDGCNMHVCCLLGLDEQQCQDRGYDNNFDPVADCDIDQGCVDNCLPVTTPGCDCFGCCTICDDAGCVDIYTNPSVAPDCDSDSIHDPVACPVCVQTTECVNGCDDDPTDCILCPGQDESDLPPECTEVTCPGGATVCTDNTECSSTEFCSQGCCVAIVD